MAKDNRQRYKVYPALITRSGAFVPAAAEAMIGIGRNKKEAFEYVRREMCLRDWEGYPQSSYCIEIKDLETPGYIIDIRKERMEIDNGS